MKTLKQRFIAGRKLWCDPRAGISVYDITNYTQWWFFALLGVVVGFFTYRRMDSLGPAIFVWPIVAYNIWFIRAIKLRQVPKLWISTLCSVTTLIVVGYASSFACYYSTLENPSWFWVGFFALSALAATWVYGIMFKVSWVTPDIAMTTIGGFLGPAIYWGIDAETMIASGLLACLGMYAGGWWANKQGRKGLSANEAKALLEEENAKLQAEKAARDVLGGLEREIAHASAEDQATRTRLMREVLDLASEAEEPLAAIQAVIDDPKYGYASKYVLRRLSRSSHALGTISLRGEDYWIPSGQIDAVEQLERAVSMVREIHSSVGIDVTIGEIPHPRLHWQNVEATFVLCLTTLMLYLIDTGATRLWARVTWDDLIVIDIEGDTQLPEDVRRSFATAILRKQHDPRWGLNKLPVQLQRVRYFFDPSKIFVDNTRPERQWGNPHANDPERRNNATFEIRVPASLVVGAEDPMKVATRGWQRPQPKEGVH